ncbi:hypothetical protein Q8G38_16760 [Halomonas venusta]|uniref:hypothetical protein n=1 Tax=Vreelandella venusta TaxID=44935 RepID=UPI00295E4933|nr:hypothetical protein [Halomonas venusta]MDW0360967.1 hypothetical protein [Halomonas venusta]
MSNVGQRERATQQRIVDFFQSELGYRYLGDRHDQDNKNIDVAQLSTWLRQRGTSEMLITRAMRQLEIAAALWRKGQGRRGRAEPDRLADRLGIPGSQ